LTIHQHRDKLSRKKKFQGDSQKTVRRLITEAAIGCEVNRWNIPNWLEQEVIARDRNCVYCGVDFVPVNETRRSRPSWEHIVNDARIVDCENIARCCLSCNASKGAKDLADWLESKYCKKKGITRDTVAEVVRRTLANPPKYVAAAPTPRSSGLPSAASELKR
jgi:hypothetical protein